MSEPRQKELADFLRTRRQRLSPAQAGLPSSGRRLTPGLRREEVAQLAGIGVDWYARLEQGRPVTPSAGTVESLGRALRLSDAELKHLRALTRPQARHVFTPETVSPLLRKIVAAYPHPAYVTGRRWDVLAWNAAAEDLFGFGEFADDDRNTLLIVLTSDRARRMLGERWEEEARRMVAQFRATRDLAADDPGFKALLDRLRKGCTEFDGWWKMHDVRPVSSGRKVMLDAGDRLIEFGYATFQVNDNPSLKLALHTPD